MTDVRLVALAKVIKDKALKNARQGLSIGTHNLDFAVRVTGFLKVGENGESRETVDWKAAFATAIGMLQEQCSLREVELTQEQIADLIGVIFRQDTAAMAFSAPFVALIEREENRFTRVTGTKPKNGSITTKLNCEFVPLPVDDIIETQRKALALA